MLTNILSWNWSSFLYFFRAAAALPPSFASLTAPQAPLSVALLIVLMKNVPLFYPELFYTIRKLDVRGAVLYFMTISLLLFTLNLSHIANKYLTALGFALAATFAAVFILIERKMQDPLLNIKIFKNPLFSLSILCSFLAFAAISSINIIHPFYLQDILLLSAGVAGFFMMIAPIVTFVTSPVSGYASDKIGSIGLTFIGLCIETAGLICLSMLNEISPLLQAGLFIGFAAFGAALFHSPNTSLIMSSVDRDKLGVAGSINALVRNLGMTVGIIVSTGVLYNRMSVNLGEKVLGYVAGEQTAFIYGMHWAYMTAASICAAGAVLTGIRIIAHKRAFLS